MSLINTFYGVLGDYSGPRKERYFERWGKLATKLGSKSQPYDRARALAFVVERCQDMVKALLPDIPKDIQKPGGDRPTAQELEEKSTALQRFNDVLMLVFSADQTDYEPVHCQCFKYYWDCLTAVDVVAQSAASMSGRDENSYVEKESRDRVVDAINSAGACMLRCWCLVRCDAGTAGAKAVDLVSDGMGLSNEVVTAPDRSAMGFILLKFRRRMITFICDRSLNMLEGMVNSAALMVLKPEFCHWLKSCTSFAKLRTEIVKGVDTTNLLNQLILFMELLEKTFDSDPQSLLRVVHSLDPKLKTIASAVLEPYHGGGLAAIYSTLWDSDITQLWDRDMRIFKQTDRDAFCENILERQFFRAAPFVFAVFWLLNFLKDNVALSEQQRKWPEFHKQLDKQLQKWSCPGTHAVGQDERKAPSGTEVEQIGPGKEEGGDWKTRTALAQIKTRHLGKDT